jgi:hypothetical protein
MKMILKSSVKGNLNVILFITGILAVLILLLWFMSNNPYDALVASDYLTEDLLQISKRLNRVCHTLVYNSEYNLKTSKGSLMLNSKEICVNSFTPKGEIKRCAQLNCDLEGEYHINLENVLSVAIESYNQKVRLKPIYDFYDYCNDPCIYAEKECIGNAFRQCDDFDGDLCLEWSPIYPCSELCYKGECCTPDCVGKVCGRDGCGSLCGTCGHGEECIFGVCICLDKDNDGLGTQPCGTDCNDNDPDIGDHTTNCRGLECGDDKCGGNCGSCAPDQFCQDGICQTCLNDCSTIGERICDGIGYKICRNIDGCLGYSPVLSCPSGYSCSSGVCTLLPPHIPGDYSMDLNSRTCFVRVPKNYDTAVVWGLIITLHDNNQDAGDAFENMKAGVGSDDDFLIIACPADDVSGWQVPISPLNPDSLFLDGLRTEIQNQFNIGWFFLHGFSGGGLCSFHYAVTNGNYFTGASITAAGRIGGSDPLPDGTVPFHISASSTDANYADAQSAKSWLEAEGFIVTFHEYAGGHSEPADVLTEKVNWMRGLK